MKKIHDFFRRHQNGIIILVLGLVMIIGTSIYLIVPRAKSATNYDQLIESLGGEEAIRSSWDEASGTNEEDDLFSQSSKKTSYKDTDEYKKKQADIEYKASRYNEITQGDLVLNLDTLIGDFFTAYSQYLQNPSPANSGELQKLVSSECMESILNEKTDDKGPFLVNYSRFADLDKEEVLSYVEMRMDDSKFFISCAKDKDGKWVINNFSKYQ